MRIQSFLIFIAVFTLVGCELPDVKVEDFKIGYFTQKLDHFNYQDWRTYDQRYFINDKYWDKENGPVFVYICGEYTCSVNE